jgi:hypothetical protein
MDQESSVLRTRTLAQLLLNEYGVRTNPGPETAVLSVGVNSQKLVSNNPNRVGISFINNSVNTIWISNTNLLVANQGIFIGGNGGTVTLNWRDDMTLVSSDWYGVAAVAASALQVFEVVTS